MQEIDFPTYKEARNFAQQIAILFKAYVDVRMRDGSYIVLVKGDFTIEDPEWFRRAIYMYGPSDSEFALFLSFVDKSKYSDVSLVWCDTDTGLTWDIARIFCGKGFSDNPNGASRLMNLLGYGGCRSWRLPTIEELKTLSVEKLEFARIGRVLTRRQLAFWSSEESIYSGPEKAYFDVALMERGDQRFIENDRNRATSGDGYTEAARTLMVSSCKSQLM